MTRQRALIALAALVAATAVGCGFDPGQAPVDAKKEDFCSAWNRLDKADGGTSSGEMDDYLSEFARFGTPRGIPTAARNGYEYVIDQDLTSGASFDALAQQSDGAGQDVAALVEYATEQC